MNLNYEGLAVTITRSHVVLMTVLLESVRQISIVSVSVMGSGAMH